ncbi:riboflavin synthase [bacterium]|nr:riboflavin synthase [Candidatus Omnitrophota bacterium]MBU2528648.1 riboflavin synthase [bacterium]MBU3930078.1 riboflavin synthase [bacterium]MBU4122808.1 riboflavin synthase [bacterium]
MFTGIITQTGRVRERSAVSIGIEMDTSRIKTGDSVAVNGVCLTASGVKKDRAFFDVSARTFQLTNLSSAKMVNIELPLKASDYISGHFVTGHVDGTVRLVKIEEAGNFKKLHFAFEKAFAPFIALRGSVALDGISLTVEGLSGAVFSVNVIPETIKRTNLPSIKSGDEVNFEADTLARYVVNNMNKPGEGITKEKLEKWL